MDFHKIIYDSCRDLINLSDKINVSSLFLYCQKKNRKTYADLLYSENVSKFFEQLHIDFENEYPDFANELKRESRLVYLDYTRGDIYEAIIKTRNRIITNLDNGYLKALHENDPFAIQICQIIDSVSKNEIDDIIRNAANCV